MVHQQNESILESRRAARLAPANSSQSSSRESGEHRGAEAPRNNQSFSTGDYLRGMKLIEY